MLGNTPGQLTANKWVYLKKRVLRCSPWFSRAERFKSSVRKETGCRETEIADPLKTSGGDAIKGKNTVARSRGSGRTRGKACRIDSVADRHMTIACSPAHLCVRVYGGQMQEPACAIAFVE